MGKNYESGLYYASTAIKVMEAKAAPRDTLAKIIDAKNFEEAKKIFLDAKLGSGDSKDFEDALIYEQASMYNEVSEVLKDGGEEIARVFKYSYDCQNIKAVLKAFVFSVKLDKSNLFSFGTIPAEVIETSVKYRNYEAFPKEFADAADSVCEAAAKENDPRLIDTEIDRACFALMLKTAKMSGIAFLTDIVKRKIDTVNIAMMFRIRSINGGKALYKSSICTGGSIPEEELVSAFENENEFFDVLSKHGYEALANDILNDSSNISVTCERAYLQKALETKYTPFGAEPIISFVMLRENDIKNYRVAMVGKKVSLPPETIRKRICTVE